MLIRKPSLIIKKPSLEQKEIMLTTIFFFLCLIPFGIDGLSVNYLFVLLPLIYFFRNHLLKPPKIIYVSLLIYILVFIFSNLISIDQHQLFFRRVSSFLIFISIFAYAFIPISEKMKESFEMAIVLASLYFSVFSIISFMTLGISDLMELKNLIGSQRYGFVYLMGIAILVHKLYEQGRINMVILFFLSIIISGLLLTLSRSSILSFMIMAILFLLASGFQKGSYKIKTILVSIIFALTASLAVFFFLPDVPYFFVQTLINPLFNAELITASADVGSSEGIRISRIREVLDFLSTSPILGNGFLGIWAISETGSGSAHNQLLDTFLRVGIIGFVAYLVLGLMLLKYLLNFHKSLFWGFLGILIYGLFHETFKESQGAFILAFLIGSYSQHIRNTRTL